MLIYHLHSKHGFPPRVVYGERIGLSDRGQRREQDIDQSLVRSKEILRAILVQYKDSEGVARITCQSGKLREKSSISRAFDL